MGTLEIVGLLLGGSIFVYAARAVWMELTR